MRQESIEVDCSDTIKWLRDEINNKMNIKLLPVIPYIQPLLLVYANETLEDERTIGSYNIQFDCSPVVHVIKHLPGGGDGWCLGAELGINCSMRECIQTIFNSSTVCTELHKVVAQRSNAWKVICDAFNMDDSIKDKIEDHSADPSIRLTDAVHYLYHQSHWWHRLTWHDVLVKVRRADSDLAEVIQESGLVDNSYNQNACVIL